VGTAGIVLGMVSPHPPIVVPEIGEHSLDRVRATCSALQAASRLVMDQRPDTVVVISPHGPVLRNAVTLLASPILEGNFREFGIEGSSLRFGNDLRLVHRVTAEASARGVSVFPAEPQRASSMWFPGSLHYSVLVPLYYLHAAGYEGRVVAGAVGLLPYEELYRFGQAVQAASEELGIRVVYVASGDLSHRLTESAPAGYDPLGKVFDQTVVDALGRADAATLMSLDPDLVERAGECGLGPLVTLFGALDGLRVTPYVHSYEGPFGVGYCVATYVPVGRGESRAPAASATRTERPAQTSAGGTGPAPEPPVGPAVVAETEASISPGEPRTGTGADYVGAAPARDEAESGTFIPQDEGEPGAGLPRGEDETGAGLPRGEDEPGTGFPQDEAGTGAGLPEGGEGTGVSPAEDENEDDEPHPQRQHPFVRLARLSLETFVRERRQIQPPPGCPGLDRRAGAFVSLKKHGELRGCIGTIEATTPNLAEEIIRNAIQAGTADPRFYPVTEDELDDLVYSVDVLEPPEPVFGPADLDPKVYGVIVTNGRRTGLLLPDLEGIETAEQQLAIARQKAGLAPDDPDVRVYRFRVTRYR